MSDVSAWRHSPRLKRVNVVGRRDWHGEWARVMVCQFARREVCVTLEIWMQPIPDNLSLRANLSVKLNELSCSPVQVSQPIREFLISAAPTGCGRRTLRRKKQATFRSTSQSEVRRAAWQSRLETSAWTAEPNRGHLAVVDLERSGRLHALVTQNIDGLHQRAGLILISSSRCMELFGIRVAGSAVIVV